MDHDKHDVYSKNLRVASCFFTSRWGRLSKSPIAEGRLTARAKPTPKRSARTLTAPRHCGNGMDMGANWLHHPHFFWVFLGGSGDVVLICPHCFGGLTSCKLQGRVLHINMGDSGWALAFDLWSDPFSLRCSSSKSEKGQPLVASWYGGFHGHGGTQNGL